MIWKENLIDVGLLNVKKIAIFRYIWPAERKEIVFCTILQLSNNGV